MKRMSEIGVICYTTAYDRFTGTFGHNTIPLIKIWNPYFGLAFIQDKLYLYHRIEMNINLLEVLKL